MKLKTVGMYYGEVRSANYQSCRIEAYLEAELETGDDENVVLAELERRCIETINFGFDRHEGRKVQKLLDKAMEKINENNMG